ncbi:lactoylglutathione lyase [Streptomyces sp. NPDC058008]|uniref:lactoylglutathione lyase n=1 Tax=Streptomyces sp. NPDC058008 TaxID=3346303 RepID=UPI0036DFF49D
MPAAPTAAPVPDRWFRATPDSSGLSRSRLLTRSLIPLSVLDERIRFYEGLTGTAADLRMPIPDFGGLELAAVGNILLIASIRPFTDIQRRTAHSVIVPSLKEQLDRLLDAGATVLEPAENILPGSRARVRLGDGTIAELVEHRPLPGEHPRPAPYSVAGDTTPDLLVRRAVSAADFAATVARYESALDTPSHVRVRLDGAFPVELALIGGLLVVGTDGPEFTRSADVRLALVTSVPLESAYGERLSGSTADRHHLVTLRDGTRAEVWDGSVGLRPPSPSGPGARAAGAPRSGPLG